jgi:hypothetical protein
MITIGAGLKTFTVASVGAFIPGMRIRAVHNATPATFVEGPANVASGTTIIITVDKFNGSGSHDGWVFASAGEIGATGSTGATGATGATGPTGVVTATAPVTYNSGTQTIGLDLTNIAPKASPTFTGTVTLPFTNSGIVHSTSAGVMGVSAAAPGLGYIPYTAPVTGLYSWQNLALIPKTNVANAFTVGGHSITAEGTAIVPLVLKGSSGQTGNLFEIQNNAGTVLSRVTSTGVIETGQYVNMATSANAGIAVGGTYRLRMTNGNTISVGSNASTVNFIVQGVASQSANLQEWQNSAGTILGFVSAAGVGRFENVGTSNGVAVIGHNASGGHFTFIKANSAMANPGSGAGRVYFRDGTTAGTLKLVVRAGASGAETTILDNIPQ